MKKLLLTAMIGMWATGALAHSPLKATTPAHETSVSEVPSEISFDFKGKIRLTRVTMTHGDHPSVDLDLGDVNGFISDYVIPIQPMGSGVYLIEWRGLGADGHAMTGAFNFTVNE